MENMEDRLTLLAADLDTSVEDASQMRDHYRVLKDYLASAQAPTRGGAKSVLVIGGGIAGIMAAYYLHERGCRVTVIDRKSFGAAASARNGGGILALGRDLFDMPFIRVSFELWEELTNRGFDTKLLRSGHMMVAMNELEWGKLQQAHLLYQAAGLDTVLLTPQDVVSRLPDVNKRNKGGLLSKPDGQGYPFTAMASLIDRLTREGVAFIADCEALDFLTAGGQIRSVRTNRGEFTADEFLLAAGPWTSTIGNALNVSLPVKPRRSQIMVTEIVRHRAIDPFVSANGLYLRQTHTGNVLYGGGGAWEISGFDVSNSIEAVERLTSRFVELFPGLTRLHLIRAFAGTVEISPDHFALFGFVRPYDNLFVSSGYSGHGYGIAPVFGKLAAKLIGDAGDESGVPASVRQLLERISPARYREETVSSGHGGDGG